MIEDLNYKKDIYFPSYSGSNDNLIYLVNKTSKIICDCFSNAEKYGPLPLDGDFNFHLPDLQGSSQDELFLEIENLISHSFNPVHPGSLAHLDPPPLLFSILGDLIAAALNNNLLAYELSPSITRLEESIINWFSKRIGFKNCSGGIVASGGTLSNLNALITARHNSGLGSDPNAVLLVSEDAHSSFKKCIRIMGLHDNNLIKIPTNTDGCMDLNNLNKTVKNCIIKNKKIFSIVATLGTTIRGSIDPIKGISDICRDNNIWLHIDGSIGGIYAITSICIEGLKKISCANSITINPQKILGITKTSSLLLVSNIETLKNTFTTGLPYVSSDYPVINRGELGIQGSRPAEIIKLWLGLRFLGMQGIEEILNSAIHRRKLFEKHLNIDKFEIYTGPLHIISFLPKRMNINESNLWTKDKIHELMKNHFMLSRPKFKDRYFLRAVMGNYNTSEHHINKLLKILNK